MDIPTNAPIVTIVVGRCSYDIILTVLTITLSNNCCSSLRQTSNQLSKRSLQNFLASNWKLSLVNTPSKSFLSIMALACNLESPKLSTWHHRTLHGASWQMPKINDAVQYIEQMSQITCLFCFRCFYSIVSLMAFEQAQKWSERKKKEKKKAISRICCFHEFKFR